MISLLRLFVIKTLFVVKQKELWDQNASGWAEGDEQMEEEVHGVSNVLHGAGDVAQVVEYLPSRYKTLSSNPTNAKKRRNSSNVLRA
jgi:hypothetical protein